MALPSGCIDITAIATIFGVPYSMIALTGRSYYDSSNNAYRTPTNVGPSIYNVMPNTTFTLPTGVGSFYGFSTDASGANRVAGNTDTYIYTSTDSGVTWTLRTGTGFTIADTWNGSSVTSSPGNYNNGSTYTSTDSGATWIEQGTITPGTGRWYGFASSSDGTKIVTGNANNGYIYTSTDSGATFTERTAPGTGYWYGFASDTTGTNIAVANYANGNIYKSTDSGATWSSTAIAPVAPTLTLAGSLANSVAVNWTGATRAMSYAYTITPSVGTKVATVSGATGSVAFYGLTASTSYTTTVTAINAFGSTTSTGLVVTTPAAAVPSPLNNWGSCGGSYDGTRLTMGTLGATVFTSTDSGITWTSRTGAGITNSQFYQVIGSTDGSRFVTGNQTGIIYTSTNSGMSWRANTVDPSGTPWFIVLAGSSDTRTIITAGLGNSYVYVSRDFGLTWTIAVTGLPAPATTKDWGGVASSSDGTILLVGDKDRYMYRSTDSGLTWTQLTAGGTGRWARIACSSDGTKIFTAN
jgi:hypothetical protein